MNATMTQDEYEKARRRLEADAADAKKTYIRAKSVYDGICNELRDLRVSWQEQQAAAQPTGEDDLPLPAVGCESWRHEHRRADLCPIPVCGRCRHLEKL